MVVNRNGTIEEENDYYPFGGLFASAGRVQPYKYNGKELDMTDGLNLYDYGARMYNPMCGRFTTIDPLAESEYSVNSYTYCLNNPMNIIDPTGKLVIFINGMHAGSGGSSLYWSNFDFKVMDQLKDHNSDYIDGSFGGTKSIPWNLSAKERMEVGFNRGKDYASYFLFAYQNNDGSFKESIKVITHSMGAAFAKGFINGLIVGGVPIEVIELEADFAPFQPLEQKAVKGIRTLQFSNDNDPVANNRLLNSPFGAIHEADVTTDDNKNKGHSIIDFWDKVDKLPPGNYRIKNGKIIPL